jgi:predicted ATP-grasp superfamily ATP-dependent carboligase
MKPSEPVGFRQRYGVQAVICETAAAVEDAYGRSEPFEPMVQELIPGGDDELYSLGAYLGDDLEPLGLFCGRKLRQTPPGIGTARLGEAVWVDEVVEAGLDLLRALGCNGLSQVEYKRDPRDGRFRLMEINGRCYLSHALATRCGVNYPLLTWQEHAQRQRVKAARNGWRGVWLHMHADLLYTAVQERGPDWKWGDFIRSYTGPWIDAVWSAADPAPFVAQWRGTLRKAAQEIRDGEEMKEVRNRFQAMPSSVPTPFTRKTS